MSRANLLSVLPVCQHFVRNLRKKHWNPGPKEYWNRGIPNFEWRKGRAQKFVIPKGYLTYVQEIQKSSDEDLTMEERRSIYKEKGIAPVREWNEEAMHLPCSAGLVDPYVPPEGDGKASLLSVERSKQESSKVVSKGKSMLALRKIRQFLEYFDPGSFAPEAMDVYLKAHQCLVNRDSDKIFDYVTEKCYPEMTRFIDCKTLRWQFIKSLEPPRIVHVRYIDGQEAAAQFGQVTVRFHTAQTLAIYDSFGRLIHGDEAVVKNVLEYIVFENHMANIYGKWRIHGKIVPSWMPPRDPIPQTFEIPDSPAEPEPTPPAPVPSPVSTTDQTVSN